MNITFLTAGTGSYHCGACMRDNTLVTALHRSGHQVALLPLYLPMTLDEEALPQVKEAPIFFGGINVYLQQKFALFRHTPKWLDRLLNGRGLLRSAARRSHMTSARDHGEMTLAMLRVDESPLTKELDKLLDWLEHHEKPDVVCLSNALLSGLAREVKKRLGVPVITFFQGEDTFLDGLPEPFRSDCWSEMGKRLKDSDLLASPSRFYADLMTERLGLEADTIRVMPNGIDLSGYQSAEPGEHPTIGYFARMTREKGLELVVDAFLELRREGRHPDCRLKIGGTCTEGDEQLVGELKQRIEQAGLSDSVSWHPNVSREEKATFFRSLSVFSVPVAYPEAFGLYLVEAQACGVPAVQPDASSFPEILEATGGGVVVPPGDAAELAKGWERLLADPDALRAMGESGRRGAVERFSVAAMKESFEALAGELVGADAESSSGARQTEMIS